MKKIFILLSALVLLTGCTNNDEKASDSSHQKPKEGYTRFFTDEMKAEYPDILEVQKQYIMYLTPPYDIKRDNKGLAGVYDKSGKLIISSKYRRIEPCWIYNMFFSAKDDENLKVLDYKNNVIFQADYDEFKCSQESWCGVRTKKDGKFGMVFYEGKEILKPEYDEIVCQEHSDYSGGFYYIASKDGRYTVVSNKGSIMIPLQEKVLKKLENNFFLWEENGKKGVVDINNKVIINPEYDSIEYNDGHYINHESYFTVCKGEKCGAAAESGKMILPVKYGHIIHKISDDYFITGERRKGMNIINKQGKVMTKHPHDSLARLNDYYVWFIDFGHEGNSGVIDIKGNLAMKPIPGVSVKSAADNGLIKIQKDGRYGIVYKNKILSEPVHDKIYLSNDTVMILDIEDGDKYYYTASFDDFIKSEGKNLKRYNIRQFVKSGRKDCYKFINDEGGADYYCKTSAKPESAGVEY